MIRFRSVEVWNFKNVEYGQVVLSDATSIDDIGFGAEVVGLYGQNGSGKTSFIEALSVLRTLMSGDGLEPSICEYVRAGQAAMRIKVDFLCAIGDDDILCDYLVGATREVPSHDPYLATYEVRIGCYLERSPLVLAESLCCKDIAAGERMHEVLSWSLKEDEQARVDMRDEDDTRPTDLLAWLIGATGSDWTYDLGEICPSTRWRSLLAHDRQLASRLEAAIRQAFEKGASMVFSTGLLAFARFMFADGDREISKAAARAINRVLLPASAVVFTCRKFAQADMVVLSGARQGVLPLRHLPRASHDRSRGDCLPLYLEKPNPVPARMVDELERALDNVSEVIGELVPGLRVEVERRGSIGGYDGEDLENIELMSVRGRVRVPLRCESEGIKRMLSIVSLLIEVHSNTVAFVAIDGLDSGVFEYLLGQILQTIAEGGRGQLVFTAHNLRPLEVLGSGSIWFTTVRPDRRYLRATGGRGSKNLRHTYLRAIRLGYEGDDVYVPTSPLRIDSALYEAGMERMPRRTKPS